MAKALTIIVNESVEDLQKYLRKASCQTIKKRIRMLLVIKNRAPEMLSKTELAKICKCNPNSVNYWRNMYLSGGIKAIMRHNWKGTESKNITEEQFLQIEEKLNDPHNGLVGYKELLDWVETQFGISVKYTTLCEYIKRKYKSKIKVARKRRTFFVVTAKL